MTLERCFVTRLTLNDFGEKWKSDWQLSGCASPQIRRPFAASTGACCKGERAGRERPETFTFLGFTHYRRKSLSGYIHVARKPSVKTRERFLREVATWLQANQHARVWVQQAHLTRMRGASTSTLE